MSNKTDSPKLLKLQGANDYAEWKRLMKAYIRREDIFLLGLQEAPQGNSNAAITAWNKAQIQAKSNIILNLGPQPQIRCRTIIDDDDKTAHELWTFLEDTYTSTNTQAIQNLRLELDSLLYKDGEDWDKHYSKFMNIVAQLASQGEDMSEKDKVSRLVRTLPESLSTIAMIATLLGSLDKVESAVRAELDWKKNPHKKSSGAPLLQANFTRTQNKGGRRKTDTRQQNTSKRTCRYCDKPGHLTKDCYLRKADEARGRGYENVPQVKAEETSKDLRQITPQENPLRISTTTRFKL